MSLRTTVLRGGYYMVLRQGLGAGISVGGVVLLTRAIGPEAYGLYAAALGTFAVLSSLSRWGLPVYLIRAEKEPQLEDYHQAFSLLLLASLAAIVAAAIASPFLERWMQVQGFALVNAVLVGSLPLSLLQLVPLARLERTFSYQKIALIELLGQISIYIVALPLAYQGFGPWAPVGGSWASFLLTFVLMYRASGYKPKLHWESARMRSILNYGFGFSASSGLYSLRYLVNPLVVGRFAGAEAIGQVALATRIVEQLTSLIMLTSERISVPVFARLQNDRARMADALTEGMNLQLMAMGLLLVGFGLITPWIVPLVFGSQWLPVVEVYPFIAVSALIGAASALHVTVLQVLGRNWKVALTYLMYIVLFAGSASLLVPYLGLVGYGWALLITILSNILLLIWIPAYIGKPRYALAGVWVIIWTIPLFSWQLGPWTWVSVLFPLVWPVTRRQLLQVVSMFLRRTREH